MGSTDFSMENYIRDMKGARPQARLLAVSARTGEGFDRLLDWIMSRR
jgi:Ni2+-binding GTPase involved in maturation of urease and hydrogenase